MIKEILHQIRSTDRIKHLTVDFLVTDSTFDIFLYLDSEFYCKDMNNLQKLKLFCESFRCFCLAFKYSNIVVEVVDCTLQPVIGLSSFLSSNNSLLSH